MQWAVGDQCCVPGRIFSIRTSTSCGIGLRFVLPLSSHDWRKLCHICNWLMSAQHEQLRTWMVFPGIWLSDSVGRNRRFHEHPSRYTATILPQDIYDSVHYRSAKWNEAFFHQCRKEQQLGYALNGTNEHYQWLNYDNRPIVIFIELSKHAS